MKISVKDGPSSDIQTGETVGDALSELGIASQDILAAKVDGAVVDLSRPLPGSSVVEPLTVRQSRRAVKCTATAVPISWLKQ